MATKQRIERAANAIKFLVPLNGDNSFEIKRGALIAWTEKGRHQTKWPKSFSPDERKLIRTIVRAVLES